MSTISELAAEAAACFEKRTRDNGTEYIARRDDAPAWVEEMVRSAHGDMMPDDWRYATIHEALEFIVEALDGSDDLGELRHEFADQVDVYTSDLLAWLQSSISRPAYCDGAEDEMGAQDGGIMATIGRGQYMERLEVIGLVLDALLERADQS